MRLKRISFKIAKAIKEIGYPQDKSNNDQYYTKDGQLNDLYYYGVPYYDVDCFAPTYLEVWLWLWREKSIQIQNEFNSTYIWPIGIRIGDYKNPEEAIIASIEYLVDNNLIK